MKRLDLSRGKPGTVFEHRTYLITRIHPQSRFGDKTELSKTTDCGPNS